MASPSSPGQQGCEGPGRPRRRRRSASIFVENGSTVAQALCEVQGAGGPGAGGYSHAPTRDGMVVLSFVHPDGTQRIVELHVLPPVVDPWHTWWGSPLVVVGRPMLQPDQITGTLHAYQLAKRGNSLRVMAEAVRWAKRGARVNAISPGIIVTPLARDELTGTRGDVPRSGACRPRADESVVRPSSESPNLRISESSEGGDSIANQAKRLRASRSRTRTPRPSLIHERGGLAG